MTSKKLVWYNIDGEEEVEADSTKVPLVSVPYHSKIKLPFFAVKTITKRETVEGIPAESMSVYDRIGSKKHHIFYLTKEERENWWNIDWQSKEKEVVRAIAFAVYAAEIGAMLKLGCIASDMLSLGYRPNPKMVEELEGLIEPKAYYSGVISEKKKGFMRSGWGASNNQWYDWEKLIHDKENWGIAHYHGSIINTEHVKIRRVFNRPEELYFDREWDAPFLVFDGSALEMKEAQEHLSDTVLKDARQVLLTKAEEERGKTP